jgi:hypothetical protein
MGPDMSAFLPGFGWKKPKWAEDQLLQRRKNCQFDKWMQRLNKLEEIDASGNLHLQLVDLLKLGNPTGGIYDPLYEWDFGRSLITVVRIRDDQYWARAALSFLYGIQEIGRPIDLLWWSTSQQGITIKIGATVWDDGFRAGLTFDWTCLGGKGHQIELHRKLWAPEGYIESLYQLIRWYEPKAGYKGEASDELYRLITENINTLIVLMEPSAISYMERTLQDMAPLNAPPGFL